MIVRDIMDRLAKGEKLKDMAASIDKSVSWVQRRLKALGYEFSNSAKVWSYVGVGEEPLDVDILSYMINTPVTQKYEKSVKQLTQEYEKSNTTVTQEYESSNTSVTHECESSNTSVTPLSQRSNTIVTPFNNAEISLLRGMIKEWQNKQTTAKLSGAASSFPKGKKSRRSVYASNSAFDAFDKFCSSHGSAYDKSDLFSLALLEFVNKYS